MDDNGLIQPGDRLYGAWQLLLKNRAARNKAEIDRLASEQSRDDKTARIKRGKRTKSLSERVEGQASVEKFRRDSV